MPKDSDRLVGQLRSSGLTAVARVVRQYRGYWQAAAGAWAWVALDSNGGIVAGSEDTMRACVQYGIDLSSHGHAGSVAVYAKEPTR